MAKNAYIHRSLSYLRHGLTAWNTTGEGIHSPYLFELVRFILRDRNSYYCFADIERRRELLLACVDEIEVLDYGSQGSPEGKTVRRRVCDIARTHLESPRVAQTLFRLANWMSTRAQRPLAILELGTSFGITTAYLAASGSRNRVVTMEGSHEVLKIAQGVWRALKMENIEWREGPIDNTLATGDSLLNNYAHAGETASSPSLPERLDIAYIDANHTCDATMRYAQRLMPLLVEKGVLIIDDIHYSEPMERAWNELKNDPRVTTSMDLYHVGMLFVDPHYLKRHYTIKL